MQAGADQQQGQKSQKQHVPTGREVVVTRDSARRGKQDEDGAQGAADLRRSIPLFGAHKVLRIGNASPAGYACVPTGVNPPAFQLLGDRAGDLPVLQDS